MEDSRPILVIEDDSDAVDLLKLAFEKARLRRPLRALPNGEAAIAYLSGAAPFENREENPRPCLLLLDVKLPGKSGIEVLSWLKSQVQLRSLPVIMMTASAASGDIDEALRLGIRSYCVKPQAFDDLVKLAHAIRRRVEGTAVESEDTLHEAGSER
jgi:DNA-binding response OmpR family regulator